MVTDTTTPQLQIPVEMRVMAARSIEQAKLAFQNYIPATQEAASTFEQRVEASQVGAQDVNKKAMSFALQTQYRFLSSPKKSFTPRVSRSSSDC